MTQTLDQKARELLGRQYNVGIADLIKSGAWDDRPATKEAIAALTEALTRAEAAERERDEARNANRVYDDATLDRELTDPLGAYKYGKAIGKETLHRVREERDAALTRVEELEGAIQTHFEALDRHDKSSDGFGKSRETYVEVMGTLHVLRQATLSKGITE